MTTSNYNLSLDDSEVIALKNALECYMKPEVQELPSKNPLIGIHGNFEIIRDIVKRQLYADVELRCTNNLFNN
jgi:hypothetical protein